MAPIYTYPVDKPNERKQHCFGGHDYKAGDHWRCYGCGRWFDNYVAHGCSGTKDKLVIAPDQKLKEVRFFLDRKSEEIKKAWKKSQYSKVTAQMRY